MSRRSITSATVVPTVSEGHSEHFSAGSADNLDYVAAVVQQMTTGPMDNRAAEEHLQVASENPHQLQKIPSSKSATLPISQTIPMNVEFTARGSFRLVNNYKALAQSFKHLQPFARGPDGKYPATTTCVLCTEVKPTSVFFPCQHMCVCSGCIDSNDMSPDCSMHLERCVCPVCSADIGLILSHTGTEEDAYWKWVLETKTCLPSQFTKDFKTFGKKLDENAIAENNASTSELVTLQRRSSDTNNPSQQPLRRSSWGPTGARRASLYKQRASNRHESCLIL